MKIVKNIHLKFIICTALKNRSILHGRVFVMVAELARLGLSRFKSYDKAFFNIHFCITIVYLYRLCSKIVCVHI